MYPVTDYVTRAYPTTYVKDTVCKPPTTAAYPKLYGFHDAGLWHQVWHRYTVDSEEGVFTLVRQSVEVEGDEQHRQDSIQVAHFTRTHARVYNLNAPISKLHSSQMSTPFYSLFRQGDKLYILGDQVLVYFKIPAR